MTKDEYLTCCTELIQILMTAGRLPPVFDAESTARFKELTGKVLDYEDALPKGEPRPVSEACVVAMHQIVSFREGALLEHMGDVEEEEGPPFDPNATASDDFRARVAGMVEKLKGFSAALAHVPEPAVPDELPVVEGQVIRNRVRCKRCNDVIESRHRHEMVYCSCKSVFVDGGVEYKRRGWSPGPSEDRPEDIFEELP